jgi:hypothetical protein
MAFNVVPVEPTAPYWTQTTTLDGVPYLLTFRYNIRESVYYLQIDSADGATNYAQGIKLVADFYLLQIYATPPGELVVLVPDSDDSPPRLGDFAEGGRAKLVYFPASTIYSAGVDPWRNPNGSSNAG